MEGILPVAWMKGAICAGRVGDIAEFKRIESEGFCMPYWRAWVDSDRQYGVSGKALSPSVGRILTTIFVLDEPTSLGWKGPGMGIWTNPKSPLSGFIIKADKELSISGMWNHKLSSFFVSLVQMWWTELCCPKIHMLKSLTPVLILNVTVFGDRVFKRQLRFNEIIGLGPNPIWLVWLLEEEIRT